MQPPEEDRTQAEPDVLDAWKAFLRAHAVLTRVLERELLLSHALPLADYDVLVQLAESAGGQLRMAQLADLVLLSRSGLTRLVERMEAGGLVRREVCPSDARGAFAVITEAGRARLESASGSHLSSIREHFGKPLDAAQVACLRQSMDQVLVANRGEAGICAQAVELEEA